MKPDIYEQVKDDIIFEMVYAFTGFAIAVLSVVIIFFFFMWMRERARKKREKLVREIAEQIQGGSIQERTRYAVLQDREEDKICRLEREIEELKSGKSTAK